MTILKLSIFLATSLLTFACGGQKKTQNQTFSNPGGQLSKSALFDKFKLLNVPRGDISIGSEWADGIGPTGLSLASSDIMETPSFSEYNLNERNDFNIKLKLNLLSFLGLSSMHQRTNDYNLHIDNASVIRVANIDKLNYSAGSTFIWEGIKVKSISLTNSSGNIDTANISFKRVNKGMEITPEAGRNGSKTLKISGLDLFVAYRLVTFGKPSIYEFDDIKIDTEEVVEFRINPNESGAVAYINTIKIGSYYVGKFFDINDYFKSNYSDSVEYKNEIAKAQIWQNKQQVDKSCNSVFTIQCNNQFINKKPKVIKSFVGDNTKYLNFILSSKIVRDQFVYEELILENLRFNGKSVRPLYVPSYPKLTHKQTTIPVINYKDDSVAGW